MFTVHMSNCMGETTKVNSISFFFSSFSIFPLPAAFHSLFIDHGWDWSYLLQNYVLYTHFFVPQIIEFYAKTRYYAQMLTINVCNQHFITLIQVTKVKSLRIQNTSKRCYLPSGPFKDFFFFFLGWSLDSHGDQHRNCMSYMVYMFKSWVLWN